MRIIRSVLLLSLSTLLLACPSPAAVDAEDGGAVTPVDAGPVEDGGFEEVPPSCGDGVVQAGEDCDDGNDVDTDACTSRCRDPFCGDGWVQPGESCDDDNERADDDCTNDCEVARCGDGVVQRRGSRVEACDDGNSENDDGCSNACTEPVCGDGVVQGMEQCEDGNDDDTDACSSRCRDAI